MRTPMPISLKNSHSKSNQRGVTMIEVLIAVVVLSLGLLGMAALQGVSIQTNQSANFRTQATLLGQQLTDSIRSNRVNVSPAGVVTSNLANYNKALAAAIPSGNPVIRMQLQTFNEQLLKVLPTAQFSIAVTAANRTFAGRAIQVENVRIVVRLSDSRLTDRFAEGADSDFVLETQI